MTRGTATRCGRALVGALVVAAVCVALPVAAGAGNAWRLRAGPNPGARYTELESVSCVTATICTAVGTYAGPTAFKSLITRTTDGIHWVRLAAPSPGRFLNVLLGVSCTSATTCTAVGTQADDQDEQGFRLRPFIVQTTNGTTWTQLPSPRPPGRESELIGVSCVTATRCRAVGDGGGRSLALITSNGTSWYRQVTPNRGRGANNLLAVDCQTTSSCTAVGYYFDRATEGEKARTLVLRTTDARTWIPVATPNPSPKTSDAFFEGVSCSGTTCTAVGGVDPAPGTPRAFIMRTVDGNTWTRSATPTAPNEVELGSVDCLSATECTAVGVQFDAAHLLFKSSLLRTTNGTSWTSPSPSSEITGHRVDHVSCAILNRCMAVGARGSGAENSNYKSLILRET
jgi:hypothetical protein